MSIYPQKKRNLFHGTYYCTAGCFEMVQYNDKQADTIPNIVEQAWICRYPSPTIITYDHRNEFISHKFKNDTIKNNT